MENHSFRPPPPAPAPVSQSFLTRLGQLVAGWIEPRAEVQGLEARHKARLLAALLLALSLALLIGMLLWVFIDPAGAWGWFAGFGLVSLAASRLARSRHYPLAVWVMMIDLSAPTYLQVLTLTGQDSAAALMARFAWLAFSMVLGGLIFSYRGMLGLTALNLAAILLLTWLDPGIDWETMLPAFGFVGVLGILIITANHQRDLLESERQQQDLRRERQLDEVTRAISSALDLPTVLKTVVQTASDLAGGDAGLLSLVSEDGSRLETVLGYNLPDEQINSRPSKGKGLAWQVIESRQALLLDDYRRHPQAISSLASSPIRAYLGVPVLAGETCLGALAVANTDPNKRFTRRDLELLEALARQAGIAIQNARLYSALEGELAERRRVEGALRQREAILESVAFAAGQFLRSQDWPRYIQTVLAELGQITHSSHAYIFQNHLGPVGGPVLPQGDPGLPLGDPVLPLSRPLVTTQLYQWTAPHAEPTLGRAEFQNVPLEGPGLERWRQAMLNGEPFHSGASSWQAGEARYLGPLGAQSILEMPVYVQIEPGSQNGEAVLEWWGLIGFDDYTNERQWSPAEVDAIKIAATILSAAIQRQRADQAIREREDIYRRAISTADAVPYYYEYNPSRYVFIGEGIWKLTGYTAAEMTIARWNSCIEQASPQGEASGLTEPQAVKLSRAGKLSDWRCDYLLRRRDGELRWVADTGVELIGVDGISHGCIGILQDITDRKQAEEATRQANQLLEKRVQERTAALQIANNELEAFAYSVSHDLRAPLRAIDGYSRILLEDHQDRLDADGQVCLDNIRQATRKMNQLIDDLLQLSRVTRQEMKSVRVNLRELALELLDAHARQEPGRIVRISVQEGLEMVGDPNLLRIALENLISNAWKFTRYTREARIEVGQIDAGSRETSAPVYYVRDNGVGFDMQYAGKLFQPFQCLHRPEQFEGTGVGLATTQRIIQRHNGRLWAESAPNQGATFYFSIETQAEWKHENEPA